MYEWQNGAVTLYYESGAIRRTGYASDNGVFYVLSDHLRSTSVLVNRDGTVKNRHYYYPYGGNRSGSAFSAITTKRFTRQYHEQGLPGSEGLSYYNARWYDAQVGVFISADTIVPSLLSPQTLNRYAYVGGNPLRYIDPTGHMQACDEGPTLCGGGSLDLDPGQRQKPYRGGSGGSHNGSGNRATGGSQTGSGSVGSATSGNRSSGGGRNIVSAYEDDYINSEQYSNAASTFQAWLLVVSWFTELGPEEYVFGPDMSLTIDVANDPQMQWVHDIWASEGYPVGVEYNPIIDDRSGGPLAAAKSVLILIREHVVELGLTTLGFGSQNAEGVIDAVGGTIGSFDKVIITQVAPGIVQFEVRNVMGMASAFRSPGSDSSLGSNLPRSATTLCCGTISQTFWWLEPIPSPK